VLVRCTTTWATPPVLLVLVCFFGQRLVVWLGHPSNRDCPTSTSWVVGITDMQHHALSGPLSLGAGIVFWEWLLWVSLVLFCCLRQSLPVQSRLALNSWFTCLHLPSGCEWLICQLIFLVNRFFSGQQVGVSCCFSSSPTLDAMWPFNFCQPDSYEMPGLWWLRGQQRGCLMVWNVQKRGLAVRNWLTREVPLKW
jgi:hypothetical protein